MSYLTTSTSIKKRFCNHKYQLLFLHGTNEPVKVCKKCRQTKPSTSPTNTKITDFTDPAFKQSNIPEGFNEDFYWTYQFNTNWHIQYNGWRLPATDEPHYWCGTFQTRGCLDVNAHIQKGYGENIFVRQYPRSCFRSTCKKCYKKWNGRQSNKATRRIEEYVKRNLGQRPIHVFFSPPRSIRYLSYEKLKIEFKYILKKARIIGGAVVFHPFRFDKTKREWNWSPHFHLVGFGSVRYIQNVFGLNGWYVGNKGIRKSVFHTFHYLLSHCGIRKRFHALTWIGDLSYCKLRVEKEPDLLQCPACGAKLVEIHQENNHSGIPPDEMFEGFVDAEGWYLVKTDYWNESEPNYEYDPRSRINEILRSLVEAN